MAKLVSKKDDFWPFDDFSCIDEVKYVKGCPNPEIVDDNGVFCLYCGTKYE